MRTIAMHDEGKSTRSPSPPPPPPRSTSGAALREKAPFQFSLRTLAAAVTAFCVLLGAVAAIGPRWFGFLVGEVVFLLTGVLAPVAVVVALIYARGYVQTFLIGVATAIVVRRISEGRSAGAFFGNTVELLLQWGIAGAGYLAAGVVAVAVRRAVESRGWHRRGVDHDAAD